MNQPKRIQMTRSKPWRADNPDAVIVDRRTKWGNPWIVGQDTYTVDEDGNEEIRPLSRVGAVNLFSHDLRIGYEDDEPGDTRWDEFFGPLRGRDLACWCPLDQPCHADVLLRMANA